MANANMLGDLDHNMPMPMSMSMPISVSVMGMTAKEYQTAFTYLEHADFAREMEEYGDQRRRATTPRPVRWYQRYEMWALVLGAFSLVHAGFVQWVWPGLQKRVHDRVGSSGVLHEACPPGCG
ncbi:hypothetical protein F5Y14DRAFT_183291 [Nemania sp. NC0429]|nr:hypothetical protein F5Y14DRAFT_183291 [Nemania sp. NC0429]